jgi:hypothetical protein
MQNGLTAQKLNKALLKSIQEIYSKAPAPTLGALSGIYQAEFTGPSWLQNLAPASLRLVHFANWWGKRFLSAQHGVNLFYDHRGLREDFPFTVNSMPSLVDGKAGLTVQYEQSVPFPWPYVIDELRFIEQNCLLGITVVNIGMLSKLSFPFLLHFWENHNGL